ncbi:MAG: transketolase C-terminal domain-containing protein [Burkholderiaceae bacterium]|nr:transketolase C-terminal domain-containing protein [Burkholderiaceae bacterium]
MIIFEHAQLYNLEEDIGEDDADWRCDIASAAVRRAGGQISLITYGGSLPKAMQAADMLAADGIEAEVIDLRVLRPLDDETILASVRKTHRALIIDEGWKTGSLSAEIIARLVEQSFYDLDAPVARLCSAEVPMPYAKHLEDAALPQVPGIVAAAKRLLEGA